VDFAEPMLEDVGEAEQDRQVDAADLEPVDERLENPCSSSRTIGVAPPSLIDKV